MNRLTATLITLNEEHNLPRALASLADLADEIIVVDSGSTDRTREIAHQRGARVFNRPWTGQADQRNFAATQASYEWILAMDADEELSPQLQQSLHTWKQTEPTAAAYEFTRKTKYLGRWILHSGWYPDRKARLYRRDRAGFRGKWHDSLDVEGSVARLPGDLLHRGFDSVSEHAAKMETYTTRVAEELYGMGRRRWRTAMILAPPWTFLHTFLLRGGWLDGYRGWLIARMAARYVFLKYRKLGVLARGGSLKSTSREAGH